MTKQKNLYRELYELEESLGKVINETPEVLNEIQCWIDCEISYDQIRKILEYVPDVFSEDWKNPEDFSDLNGLEKKAYRDIMTTGDPGFPRPFIQKVIELGIEYRILYSAPSSVDFRELLDGEYIAIPTNGLDENQEFMDALDRFQYGSKEDSHQGFEDMKRIANQKENGETQ